ncbi:MAG TPA: SPOR domain-containing protein, partial [Thermoanaerobaculia bacterium]|nr:SPOR domain-containing protein [Thermoanaerobaculia bacterium]
GVWIGRESAARNAEKLAANAAAPAAQEPQEGRSVQEYEFFEQPQAEGQAPQEEPTAPAPAEGQDTTLLEDMGGEDEDFPAMEDEQEAAPAAVPSPSPTPVQRPTAEERRLARQRERQAQQAAQQPAPARPEDTVRPRPLPEATPASPASRAAAPAAASTGGGRVVIQVFSSPERDQAERIQKRLTSGGQKAFLSPVDVGGRTMYRVRIGPFANREAAQQVAEQVRKGYKLDTWVTE